MKVLIVNDTSNNAHCGCFAVMSGLRTYIRERNHVVSGAIFNRELTYDRLADSLQPESAALLAHHAEAADLVVINGEGTIHDGRAPEIEQAIAFLIDRKIPFALCNSILRDYPIMGELLKDAVATTVRDEKSLQVARAMGLDAQRCADASIYGRFDSLGCGPDHNPSKTMAVTDWHPAADAFVGERVRDCLDAGAEYLPFLRADALPFWPGVLVRLSEFELVVCARYHAAILSVLAGANVALLPSNTDKIEEFAREFGLQDAIVGGSVPSLVEDRKPRREAIRAACERLREMRNDASLHPFHALDLPNRPVGIGSAPIPREASEPKRELNATCHARLAADDAEGQAAELLTDAAIKRCADQLVALAAQEGNSNLLWRVARFHHKQDSPWKALAAAEAAGGLEDDDSDHLQLLASIYLKLRRRADADRALRRAQAVGTLDRPAQVRRAQLLSRVGKAADAFDTMQTAIGRQAPDFGTALQASMIARTAGQDEWATDQALEALKSESEMKTSQINDLGKTLTALGKFADGYRLMSRALRKLDPFLPGERRHPAPDVASLAGLPATMYVPESVGVGTAVLATRFLPELIGRHREVGLVIDERLHDVVGRSFPSVRCWSADSYRAAFPRRSLATLARRVLARGANPALVDFHLLTGSLMEDGVVTAADGPLAPPTDGQARIRERYERLFPGRRTIGLAWYTPNQRSTRTRSLSLVEVRAILDRNPDAIFVSLQPQVRQALRDKAQIDRQNLHVDTEIDPIGDVDTALAQIAALDEVLSIDCSAAHFAGAMNRPGRCIIRHPTAWQWPMRKSWYSATRILVDGEGSTDRMPWGDEPQGG